MSDAWREYQERAADFFRRLGLTAAIEHKVEGARAAHEVDVYVEGKFHGIPFRWIVECKAWKSSVPKEKVMALAAIVQDVGADRGFLLSEAGFQAGAIRATSSTNITLSSLEELASATEANFIDASIGALNWRMQKVRERLRRIKKEKYDDDYYPPTMEPLSWLFALDFAFADALKGEFPTIYLVDGDDIRHRAENLDELLGAASRLIDMAEKWRPPDEA
jgi:hypothetical protein